MADSWNLEELRDMIRSRGGEEQLARAQTHIHSVDWKIRIASLHSQQASEAFSGLFAEDGTDTALAVRMLLSNGEEARDFNTARLAYEAHVIACAQAMHSVADVFAHLIADALDLGFSDDDHLSLPAIKKGLPDPLRQQVVRLLGLKQYSYLQDFVNRSKHVSLVFAKYNVHLPEPRRHGLLFTEFSRCGRKHAQKWGKDFLTELRELSVEYVQLGRILNETLRSVEQADGWV